MKTRSYRRRLSFAGPAIAITICVVVILGAVGLLWRSGALTARAPSTEGLVDIPQSAAAIPAYTKITRDYLSLRKMRADRLPPEVVRDLGAVLGRVVDHDKPAGYVFTERDFLPMGTRPGIVGGIPAGKRAMRVDANKVSGIFGLNPGDRFDLVATLPIDTSRGGQTPFAGAGIYGQQLALQAQMTNWMKQATVRVLVQNGVVVTPVTTRQVPITNNTLTSGTIIRMKPVQEIVLAVDPEEVARLTEALAVGAEIACIPRSGRPDDEVDSVTPDLQPFNPFLGGNPNSQAPLSAAPPITGPGQSLNMVERIQGDKREMVVVPSRSTNGK